MTALILSLLCSNCDANSQEVPKWGLIMNATSEVIHRVFKENGESTHIQSQTHITDLRLSSAKKDLSYISVVIFLWGSVQYLHLPSW